jgi:drug/metabolite transporter (DMT)-like permease
MGFLAVPVVGLASSWRLLGEPLTILDFTGAALTFAGILAVSLVPEEPAAEAPSPRATATRIEPEGA